MISTSEGKIAVLEYERANSFLSTLVDHDTDFYVLETLDIELRRKMEDVLYTEEWTDNVSELFATLKCKSLMDLCRSARMKELHAKDVKREEIEAALNDLPFVSDQSTMRV